MKSEPSPEEAVLQAAARLSGAERAMFLNGACYGDSALRERLEALLSALEPTDLATKPNTSSPTIKLDLANNPDEAVGQTLDRYKLLEKVGEGGCGVVYVAEQTEPVRRRVALKVIKLGMDTKAVVARFEAERQALAMMDHPNIAKVLDAGTTEQGRPFFVMELVRGIRITDYCDQNNLTTKERLELFIKVCQAIQHAHQKGIIHRDIKPSNILVTLHDGVPLPKVIDFGISKAIEGRLTDNTVYTQLHQFIGTPAYMSPEQAEMSGLDIDTRSDIYSLGVLLYELLVGCTPFDAGELISRGIDAMRKTIREKEPLRPSTRLATLKGEESTTTAKHRSADASKLLHQLKGDLDWIVMKCLEKDRTRRYETANGLAVDLRRHLQNEPVVARPPSTAYRLQKAWRRQKTAFTVAGLIAVVLVAATGISLWQAVLAKQRLAESEAVSKFLTELFQSPNPASNGHAITVAQILGAAARKLETGLADQPARRADFQATLAMTYFGLGLYHEAIPLQEKVRDYHLAASGREHPATLQAMFLLANSYDAAGRRYEALKLQEAVLALRRKRLGLEHRDTLQAMNRVAHGYFVVGRQDEALKMREETLILQRKVLGPDAPETITTMNGLAESYFKAGRQDEALKMREEVLALRRKVNGPESPRMVQAMANLVSSYNAVGRRDEALALAVEVLALGRKVLGPEHPNTLNTMRLLAACYFEAGRSDEAISLLAKASEIDPQNTDVSLDLATSQTWFGRDADYQAARCRLVQQAEGTDLAGMAECAALACCLRPSTNADLLMKVLSLAKRAVELGKNDPLLAWYQLALGLAEYRNGQFAAADRTLAVADQTGSELHEPELVGTARLFRAMSLFRQDKPEEARRAFTQAEAQMPPFPKDENKPLVDGASLSRDHLILWMAYKEAKSRLNEASLQE